MKQDSYVRAILVGAGPSEEKLKKMSNELGIGEKVFFQGECHENNNDCFFS